MSEPKTSIWTPDGIVDVDGESTRERVNLRPGLVEWLAQFSAFAEHFSLGLHCAKCKADIVGKNADSDRVFSVACSCREFVGENRDWRPTAEARKH